MEQVAGSRWTGWPNAVECAPKQRNIHVNSIYYWYAPFWSSEIQSQFINHKQTNMKDQEVIDGLLRTERMANVLGQEPRYVREEIASLVSGEQVPGTFGDLSKRSIEVTERHKEFEGSNVVSMIGRRTTS